MDIKQYQSNIPNIPDPTVAMNQPSCSSSPPQPARFFPSYAPPAGIQNGPRSSPVAQKLTYSPRSKTLYGQPKGLIPQMPSPVAMKSASTPQPPPLHNFNMGFFPPFPVYHNSPNQNMEKSNILLNETSSNDSSEMKLFIPTNDSVPIKKRVKTTSDLSSTPPIIVNTAQKENIDVTNASPKSEDSNEKKRKRKPEQDKSMEKKEKRLIRNRQSAQASRERKKAYIQNLETKVEDLEKRIQFLEEENNRLKEKYEKQVD